ncbi:MAG: DUF389 domain-containing protein [Bacteroidales bacterium]|jgi:uncharacterized hydrophobic protein (TIGR00271 family)|nr:DUF389 domain-containing protein [Bacteroidales bacterium]MBQ7611054.1 DUF389 domain-containing protein [Bacteroidales bacterium]
MLPDWNILRQKIRKVTNINGHIDTDDAAERIKNSIWFQGPNVWILAFSIIIASVGLNVNSTAVIIGAMLISPLMGPIIGIGLSLGTYDFDLLREALKNLLIMVLISLAASTFFFLISPLSLVNATELEARTSPTIYDVLIALFGGLAGILENSRKERGTVLSGVAIATALMPPLCTAGYGLAHLSARFFFGALYLFLINCVFITIATYLMVRYLHFRKVDNPNPVISSRRIRLMSLILFLFIAPSLWSAFNLIRSNNFERNVRDFVTEKRVYGKTYLYDYRIVRDKGRKVTLFITGNTLSQADSTNIYMTAAKWDIRPDQLRLVHQNIGMSQDEMNAMIRGIYDHTNYELTRKEQEMEALKTRIDSLTSLVSRLLPPPSEEPDTLQRNPSNIDL